MPDREYRVVWEIDVTAANATEAATVAATLMAEAPKDPEFEGWTFEIRALGEKSGVLRHVASGRQNGRRVRNPFAWHRPAGDTVTLGMCGCCSRRLARSGANKTGARCRWCGAQYDAAGNFMEHRGWGWKL